MKPAVVLTLSKLNGGGPTGYSYGYDQLNRLVSMNHQGTITGGWWSGSDGKYAESVKYDGNGNILQYLRKGADVAGMPLNMDSLSYVYHRDGNGNLLNNLLNHVNDTVNAGNYAVDIDDQGANNYLYDYIGNLKKDVAEGIDSIRWTVYGKINRIVKNSGSTIIDYGYDPGGNRTFKKVTMEDTVTTTYYIRDASGNVMGIYTRRDEETLKWSEQHLYGSSRLGIWRWDAEVPAAPPVVTEEAIFDSLMFGMRQYELSNHLGNVLSTISDKKIGHDNGAGVVDYYVAEVISQQDYYPGGMDMPGRQYSSTNSYRYGFNGKEKDTEGPVQYDYGFRIYDSRIVRFKTVDPYSSSFPWNSSYAYAEGDLIRCIDLDGLEKYVVTYWYDNKGNHRKTTIKAIRAQKTKEIAELNFQTANKKDDLTDANVWVRRLYMDGREKAKGTGKATLDASEKALFRKAKSYRRNAGDAPLMYDFGDEKGFIEGEGFESNQFPVDEYEFRMAEEKIPLIHNLNPSFNNAIFFHASPTGEGSLIPKEAAIAIDKKVKYFYDLPSLIKDDGGIKSIDITMTYYVHSNVNDKDYEGLKKAFGQVVDQVKELYLKSGVKNVRVNRLIERRSDAHQANANTPDIQINLKR